MRNAKSLGWNLQLDHELIDNLFVRTGYQFRRTTSNFLVNPVYGSGLGDDDSVLTMNNEGADLYREFQLSVRYRLSGTGHITVSYVNSSSYGDLKRLGIDLRPHAVEPDPAEPNARRCASTCPTGC